MGESRLRIRQPPFDLQNENNAQEVPLEKDYVPSGFTIEDSLSKELMQLSFNDRIAIQEELHGVRCRAANETPELIAESLYKFDVQIVARRDELQKQYQATGSFQRDISSSNNNSKSKSDAFSDNSSSSKYDFSKQQNPLRNIRSMSKSPFSSNNSGNKTQQQQQNNKPFGIHSSNCQPLNQQVEDCYVNDPNVRLRFLRCECFDVPKAVDRFVNFLELACELYGDYAAERPIHIRDFASRHEEVVLQNSRNQYLPFRDRSGRRVLIGVGTCDFNIRYDLRFKILFYLHWVASEDVETQQKGVVIVAWPCDEATPNGGGSTATDSNNDVRLTWEKVLRPQMNKRLVELYKKMQRAMPVRITANHGYFPDTPFHRALSTLYYFGMESGQRRLYKAHHGNTTELRYALASYGINEQLLPLSNTGTVKTTNHLRWVNAIRAKHNRDDQKRKAHGGEGKSYKVNIFLDGDDGDEIVDCPGSRDVIFRKGPTFKKNPGNMHFRELIEQSHDQHTRASRKEKCRITWQILNAVEAKGGRFLDWCLSREMWVVATDREKIRKKIAATYKQYNRTALIAEELQRKNAKRLEKQQKKGKQEKQQLQPATTTTYVRSASVIEEESVRVVSEELVAQESSDKKLSDSDEGTSSDDNGAYTEEIYTTTPINNKVDRKLREYYDAGLYTSQKRRKTCANSFFCGGDDYSSSDSSSGRALVR